RVVKQATHRYFQIDRELATPRSGSAQQIGRPPCDPTNSEEIHKECAETLMKIEGGACVLADWGNTIAGKCDCHLHRKLADKIAKHLAST
ncbi:MAG TPA: hypothetical protein VLA12_16645, partial [Planctomycetaceae bacterium]|nr:hypothetical protein [Planctomycetaceae bacterium]